MSILKKLMDEQSKYKIEHSNKRPEFCYLTIEEGFDLLKEVQPNLNLKPMEHAELSFVIQTGNVEGMKQALEGATYLGSKIIISEAAHGSA